ncbi:unnamed protein product [marine sediment metagenome]|uniref:Uncharacterized protein n=1 Tax=marine sediment metagenome TaxID=412755 RepID=X0T3X4_9ZZZZ
MDIERTKRHIREIVGGGGEFVDEFEELVTAIIDWWEEHEDDCGSYNAGHGFTEGYNIYAVPPRFVAMALNLYRCTCDHSTFAGFHSADCPRFSISQAGKA